MEDADMALVELSLAASLVKTLADGLLVNPEQLKVAESLLLVGRVLDRTYQLLRPVIVADVMKRVHSTAAPVVALHLVPRSEGPRRGD